MGFGAAAPGDTACGEAVSDLDDLPAGSSPANCAPAAPVAGAAFSGTGRRCADKRTWADRPDSYKRSENARLRRLRAERPDLNRAKNARWRAENPEKHAAHRAVERAIKRGSLTRKPCERCGAVSGVHAHHDDYGAPLAVRWLCRMHHKERHREIEAVSC